MTGPVLFQVLAAVMLVLGVAVGARVASGLWQLPHPRVLTLEEQAARDFAAGRIDLDALEERLDGILGIQRRVAPCSIAGCSGPSTCLGRCWRAKQLLPGYGRWADTVSLHHLGIVNDEEIAAQKPATPPEREQ